MKGCGVGSFRSGRSLQGAQEQLDIRNRRNTIKNSFDDTYYNSKDVDQRGKV